MNSSVSEDKLRELAEAEEGGSVSAGARMSHFLQALKFGRIPVEMFEVPEDQRLTVYKEILALVRRYSVPATTNGLASSTQR